jgi:thiol:disulfide interchange protein DsbD
MEEGWHSYWRNPGDAGMATTIEWDLPEGFETGELQWPHPLRIEVPPLVSYGYLDEVLLLTEVTPPDDLVPGTTVTLAGRADWLICTEICLPASAELRLELPVGSSVPSRDEVWQSSFAETKARLPVEVEGWDLTARRTLRGFDLVITAPPGRETTVQGAYFFASEEAVVAPSARQPLGPAGRSLVLSLTRSPYKQGTVETLNGVLLAAQSETWDESGLVRAMAVAVPVTGEVLQPGSEAGQSGSLTLLVALVFAFVGGLLLNLMPCVFPILSIKVLGFVHRGGEDKAKVRAHGVAFGLGVIVSFLALAAVIQVLRAGGTGLGWGFQLQAPTFVAAMALLFFVIALNLLGVFQVGTWLARVTGRIAQPAGYTDSFSSGVLATLVATPCTAPFMGTALGFALTQRAVTTLFVFGTLGIGMATPYVVLSLAPSLIERLPRPGAWMETLKQLLAFPLLGTVIWLLWVFGLQTGMGGATSLLIALLLVGFVTWILGRWQAQLITARTRLVTRGLAAIALLLAGALVVRGSGGDAAADGDLSWQPFSVARVQELRAAGRTVFVDFTAAWCITCQVNEQVVLSSRTVADAFQQYDVATLQADWTRFDSEITEALESFGRSGVPLYVLYPGDGYMSPIVLPTILSKQGVLDALSDAMGSTESRRQTSSLKSMTSERSGV